MSQHSHIYAVFYGVCVCNIVVRFYYISIEFYYIVITAESSIFYSLERRLRFIE